VWIKDRGKARLNVITFEPMERTCLGGQLWLFQRFTIIVTDLFYFHGGRPWPVTLPDHGVRCLLSSCKLTCRREYANSVKHTFKSRSHSPIFCYWNVKTLVFNPMQTPGMEYDYPFFRQHTYDVKDAAPGPQKWLF